MEQAWRDLFLLTAIEQHFPLNLIDLSTYEKHKSDLNCFQEILNRAKQLQIDPTEMICLKSLVLFPILDPSSPSMIQSFHEQAQLFLQTYIQKQYPSETHRFLQLFTLISSFRLISPSTLEEIFFRKTIGSQIEMKQLVKDMFKMIVHT